MCTIDYNGGNQVSRILKVPIIYVICKTFSLNYMRRELQIRDSKMTLSDHQLSLKSIEVRVRRQNSQVETVHLGEMRS